MFSRYQNNVKINCAKYFYEFSKMKANSPLSRSRFKFYKANGLKYDKYNFNEIFENKHRITVIKKQISYSTKPIGQNMTNIIFLLMKLGNLEERGADAWREPYKLVSTALTDSCRVHIINLKRQSS